MIDPVVALKVAIEHMKDSEDTVGQIHMSWDQSSEDGNNDLTIVVTAAGADIQMGDSPHVGDNFYTNNYSLDKPDLEQAEEELRQAFHAADDASALLDEEPRN